MRGCNKTERETNGLRSDFTLQKFACDLHVIWIWPSTHTHTHIYSQLLCAYTNMFCHLHSQQSSTWIIVANICIESVHNLDPFVMQSTLQSLQKEKHTIAWSYLVSDVYIHKCSQWGQWDDSHVRSVNSQSLRMFCEWVCVCDRIMILRHWILSMPVNHSDKRCLTYSGVQKNTTLKKWFKPGNKLHFEQFKTKKCYNV